MDKTINIVFCGTEVEFANQLANQLESVGISYTKYYDKDVWGSNTHIRSTKEISFFVCWFAPSNKFFITVQKNGHRIYRGYSDKWENGFVDLAVKILAANEIWVNYEKTNHNIWFEKTFQNIPDGLESMCTASYSLCQAILGRYPEDHEMGAIHDRVKNFTLGNVINICKENEAEYDDADEQCWIPRVNEATDDFIDYETSGGLRFKIFENNGEYHFVVFMKGKGIGMPIAFLMEGWGINSNNNA